MNHIYHSFKKKWADLQGKYTLASTFVVSLGLILAVILSVLTLEHLFLLKTLPNPQQESLYAVDVQLVENNLPIESSMLVLERLKWSKNNNLDSICTPCLPLLW
jgi:hypothetical protein